MSEELISEKDSNNQINSNKLIRNGLLAKSIIKKYISGEEALNDVKHPIKSQSSIFIMNNKCKTNLKLNNTPHTNSNKILNKRMTLGPDKMRSILKMEKSFLNKHANNSINSDKSLTNKSNNYISEEKEEDIDYINIYKEKKNEEKTNIKNTKKELII